MRRLYHICISNGNEPMFRSEEDYRNGANFLALALFDTGTELFADSLMSNHVHFIVQTKELEKFVWNFRMRYSFYFKNKYNKSGRLGEKSFFRTEVVGHRHQLAAISYVFRNGLHHGLSPLPFGYPHSSVGCIFQKDLGKKSEGSINSREEIKKFLPRHSEFPDHYIMDKDGMIMRESFVQVPQVEFMYSTPRAFIYNMTRPSGEQWIEEQKLDEKGSEPVTLNMIEYGTGESPDKMAEYEKTKFNKNTKTDTEVCTIIDTLFLPKLRKKSVYLLNNTEKNKILQTLVREMFISEHQAKRCLVL